MNNVEKRFIEDYVHSQHEMYGIKKSIIRTSLHTLKKTNHKEYQRMLDDFFDKVHPY